MFLWGYISFNKFDFKYERDFKKHSKNISYMAYVGVWLEI